MVVIGVLPDKMYNMCMKIAQHHLSLGKWKAQLQ